MTKSAHKKGNRRKKTFQPQPQDIEYLEAIGNHRYLRSTHLDALFPRNSPTGIRRRMHRLVKNGYAKTLPISRRDKKRGGRQPLVYGLNPKAKKLLRESTLLSPTRIAWLTRQEREHPSIEHQLMISDFLVSLARESAKSDAFTFISPWNFSESVTKSLTITLRVSITVNGKRVPIAIKPDSTCAITYRSNGQRRTRVLLYEAYRNRNINLTAKDWSRKTILKTLKGYEAVKYHGRAHQYFPYPFTVVVASNISPRLESIRSLISNRTLFRFLDSQELQNQEPLIPRILKIPHSQQRN